MASGGGKGGGVVGGEDNGEGGGGGGGEGGGVGPSLYSAPCLPPSLSPPRGWQGPPLRCVVADVIIVVDADGGRNRRIAAIRRRCNLASRRRRHQRWRCRRAPLEVFLLVISVALTCVTKGGGSRG